ncbi:hypothetical protein [Neobacillus cucumis]|uniref:Uncharacterized protein n=1 Tax=Neobacillus cucumis TaxID=1740721 RepID=A0A2N5HMF5_9BACI|nr:hypothetical protein [Neobacillus cucumis]PLS06705.1 hypothetical protein CVD27_07200 [Neobacillus cucumis]
MNLHTQLALGNFGDTLGSILTLLILIFTIPLLIWLIISLVFLVSYKKKKAIKWWGIIVGICCFYGIIVLGYSKIFNGAPFTIAQRIHVYIPMSVHVLEDYQESTIDSETEYEVIRFSHPQMNQFIQAIRDKGWKYGTVVPNSMRHPKPNDFQDLMVSKKYPLPKEKKEGYYYSYIKKTVGDGDWYTKRKAYFLDVKTRTLYIYYDNSQWS